MSHWEMAPRGALKGSIRVPGDKSISHRSLLFNAFAQGEARVEGLLRGLDVQATWGCLKALGVEICDEGDVVVIRGVGGHFRESHSVLDCGNSGTTFRLLCGLLAGQPIFSVLTGDKHLKKRPMKRVTGPLEAMGARFWGRENASLPPIAIHGGQLRACDYSSPIASAQVKTAILLATLQAEGEAVFREPHRSRDHSERMLRAMGADIQEMADGALTIRGGQTLAACDVVVPGDISSAAFFLVAASIVPGSDLCIEGVGLNPTRTGILDALWSMGADISVENQREVSGEPIGNLRVRYTELKGTQIEGELIPRLVDELPVLAVAAACADGETIIRDAAELRVKESDRIAATAAGLRVNGIDVEETPDGMIIQGGRLQGGHVSSAGDHRIAMAFGIAALAGGASRIDDVENVKTSFPNFRALLSEVCSG